MKKLSALTFFILPPIIMVALFVVLFVSKPESLIPAKNSPIDKVPTPKKIAQSNFQYAYFKVSNLNNLRLIVNSDFISSEKLIDLNNCRFAINGGFYSTEKKPLGLIIVDGQKVSGVADGRLLDGYIWQSELGGFGITRDLPDTELKTALQSGPMLVEAGKKQKLAISNDKLSRRSVLATLADGVMMMLIVYDQTSVFLGPKLQELPQVLEKISEQEKIMIIEAINLDGGSASMFKNNETSLFEYKPIGSMWCVAKE